MKILTTLLEIGGSFLRLLEAEGRMLRRALINMVWALAFVAIAALLVLVASGFLLAGLYQYFSMHMSPAAASILVTIPTLFIALIFAGIVKWLTDDLK